MQPFNSDSFGVSRWWSLISRRRHTNGLLKYSRLDIEPKWVSHDNDYDVSFLYENFEHFLGKLCMNIMPMIAIEKMRL